MKVLRIRALVEVELTTTGVSESAPLTEFTVAQASELLGGWVSALNASDGRSSMKVVGQPFVRTAYVRDES